MLVKNKVVDINYFTLLFSSSIFPLPPIHPVIQIGQKRDLPISEVANEWMSFSSSKHLQLNYDNIEKFSLWVCYLCNKFNGTHTHGCVRWKYATPTKKCG